VSITGPDHRLVILDAGSGIRPLGHDIMHRQGGRLDADLLLSHTHWDHIQGIPFFKPLSVSGTTLSVYGAAQGEAKLSDILRRQMDPMVFPVPLTALGASLTITEVAEGTFDIEGFEVGAFRLRHPGTTLGYRLTPSDGGRALAYLTDNELGPGGTYAVSDDWRPRLVRFLEGTDTLIHDAMYADQIMPARAGWGHSTPRQAVDLAAEAGCRRLLLFHHEPEHNDDALEALLAKTRDYACRTAPALAVDAAMEGMRFPL
jgi:ribonuclease BN (tRNA processing enzyme)